MLPRFPATQKVLFEEYTKRMLRAKDRAIPHEVHPVTLRIIEGKFSQMQREDGSMSSLDIKPHEVSVTIDNSSGKGMTIPQFAKSADDLGQKLGNQLFDEMFAAINEAVEKTGNMHTIKGRLTKDDFLKIIDSTPHAFDEKGLPTNVMLCSPEMAKDFERYQDEWSQDADFVERANLMKLKKKEEFLEREARRRLVE